MNREHVRRAIDKLKLSVVVSDPNGINIRRAGFVAAQYGPWRRAELFGTWIEETWRVSSGSGIAGHSGEWWIRHIGAIKGDVDRLGPFKTMRELTKTLRLWRDWEVP